MNTVEIIVQLIKEHKITAKQLLESCKLPLSSISEWKKGKSSPSLNSASKIADYFDVSVDYLLGKTDDPSPRSTGDDSIFSFPNIARVTTKKIPLLGNIAAGEPIYADERHEHYIDVDGDIQADFALKVKGDSMINARINDGDIVFIKKQPMVRNGEIAAVIIGDDATLKRVYYYPEKYKIILQAENPVYEPLVYTDQELESIRIIGKAIVFQSDVK